LQLGRHNKKSTEGLISAIERADIFGDRNLAAVVRSVLVIRIVAKDAATPATEAELADKIFGARRDVFNLKSAMNQCSDGQMKVKPLSTNKKIGSDGVYTVNLPNTNVVGSIAANIVTAAITQATSDLGVAPSSLANHIMFCIPPGTGAWVAYASVNHWQSVYNGDWCKSPSAAMHEIGEFLRVCQHGNDSSQHPPLILSMP
jgi:hypothetical protein